MCSLILPLVRWVFVEGVLAALLHLRVVFWLVAVRLVIVREGSSG